MNQYTEMELQTYHNEVFTLKRQLLNPNSKTEFVKLQLKGFYHILNKNVRFMFLTDIRTYFETEHSKLKIQDINSSQLDILVELEMRIRSNPLNDKTVNFILCGLIEELEKTHTDETKHAIYLFAFKLITNMRKYTAMNYTSEMGGGLVLYTASLRNKIYNDNLIADAIFYFGPEIMVV